MIYLHIPDNIELTPQSKILALQKVKNKVLLYDCFSKFTLKYRPKKIEEKKSYDKKLYINVHDIIVINCPQSRKKTKSMNGLNKCDICTQWNITQT